MSESQIQFRLIAHRGEVVLSWGVSLQWAAFTPDQAREIAASLVKVANEIEGQKQTVQ